MAYIKVDREILLAVSEEMKTISSEVSNLNRNYYEIASRLELDIRDCYHIRKAADRLQSRLENELKGIQNIGDFLVRAFNTYAFFDDTSSIPDNQENSGNFFSGTGDNFVSGSEGNGGNGSSFESDDGVEEKKGFFEHIPILGPAEDLFKYYTEVITGKVTYSTKEILDKGWKAFDDTISLWEDAYSEVERVLEGIKELPAGEIARWVPVVNAVSSTGSEWSYWYNEYTQDGIYSGDEILKTLVYASTNGLMHIGSDLADVASNFAAVPESVLLDKLIDEGGSRDIADMMMNGAEELGTWIGNTIVNLKKKWR